MTRPVLSFTVPTSGVTPWSAVPCTVLGRPARLVINCNVKLLSGTLRDQAESALCVVRPPIQLLLKVRAAVHHESGGRRQPATSIKQAFVLHCLQEIHKALCP